VSDEYVFACQLSDPARFNGVEAHGYFLHNIATGTDALRRPQKAVICLIMM